MQTKSIELGIALILPEQIATEATSLNTQLAKQPFEIRARGTEGIGRAMFGAQVGQRIVILTAFFKKTQQTPASELALARKRLKEINRE